MASTRILVLACSIVALAACGSRPTGGDLPEVDSGLGMDASHADGSTMDATTADGSHPTDAAHVDLGCAAIDCIPTPTGCTHVDDGSCCGTFTCPDAGTPIDAGCPLPPCVAPPLGCHYVGAGCGTCGTIVCSDAGSAPDCTTTGCPSGTTCRVCGPLTFPPTPPSCVADGTICPG